MDKWSKKFNIKQFKGHFCDFTFKIDFFYSFMLDFKPGDRVIFQSILTKYGKQNKW